MATKCSEGLFDPMKLAICLMTSTASSANPAIPIILIDLIELFVAGRFIGAIQGQASSSPLRASFLPQVEQILARGTVRGFSWGV